MANVATITPVLVGSAPTTIADLTTGPGTGFEWSVAVRVANTTATTLTYRLYLTLSSDNTQTSGTYRVYDFSIAPGDARDMEQGLMIPNGYKLQHRASGSGLSVSVTGRVRSTV